MGEAIRAQLEFVAREAEVLGARGTRLIDGHGDLRPEHVYLGSESDDSSVIDCLEFDPTLRRLDAAEETAFLALECVRLGASDVAYDLLCGVRTAMADSASDALLHFYMSQRAVTRAKVSAWHLRDPQLASRARHWKARAYSYLDDALHFARLALAGSPLSRALLLERHRPAVEKGSQRYLRQHSLQKRPEGTRGDSW